MKYIDYIDVEKLRAEIEKRMEKYWDNLPDADSPEDDWTHNELCELGAYKELEHIEDFLNSLQQKPPKLYKDESLGSPDYERGFKHGRDYQTSVEQKYTNKDRVIAYLVDKGYPVSTNGEIPTYQETFDMINNAIKYANKQEQPEVDLEEKFNDFLDNVEGVPRMWHSDEQIEWGKDIARHFYELGRKQVLQEIYNGKTKPVDKITAAWLDDKEEESK